MIIPACLSLLLSVKGRKKRKKEKKALNGPPVSERKDKDNTLLNCFAFKADKTPCQGGRKKSVCRSPLHGARCSIKLWQQSHTLIYFASCCESCWGTKGANWRKAGWLPRSSLNVQRSPPSQLGASSLCPPEAALDTFPCFLFSFGRGGGCLWFLFCCFCHWTRPKFQVCINAKTSRRVKKGGAFDVSCGSNGESAEATFDDC